MERMKRTTLSDVAKRSGVSTTTVSYVLNRTVGHSISQSTRDRVEQAVADLGYVPNNAARVLRVGASNIVLLDTGSQPSTTLLDEVIAGIDAEVAAAGFTLLVHHGENALASLDEVADAISARAVISLDPREGEEETDPSVGVGAQGALQVDHLVSRGHSKIAIAVPDSAPPQLERAMVLRTEGVTQRLADNGLEPAAITALPGDLEDATEALRQLREQKPEVTAIAAYNDDVAFVVLAAARTLGIRIPEDWAVIGVDNTPNARLSYPSLTSVSIDTELIGRALAQFALGRTNSEPFLADRSHVVKRETT